MLSDAPDADSSHGRQMMQRQEHRELSCADAQCIREFASHRLKMPDAGIEQGDELSKRVIVATDQQLLQRHGLARAELGFGIMEMPVALGRLWHHHPRGSPSWLFGSCGNPRLGHERALCIY